MNLNRPLQIQRQIQRRPAEAGRYKVKTLAPVTLSGSHADIEAPFFQFR
jgi:hypothetical protein